MQMIRRLIPCLLLACSLSLTAQTKPCTVTSTFDPAKNAMVTTKCDTIVHQSSVHPDIRSGKESSKDTAIVNNSVLQSEADYALWSNDYTRRIFEHQIVYTVIIFAIVNLLVVSGLYFAWIQFRATMHLSHAVKSALPQLTGKQATADTDQTLGQAPPPPQVSDPIPITELKLGPDGLAISSAFIGLIILGFSMGFYILYLKYVYPIKTVGSESQQTTNSESIRPQSSPAH
jgi:hypothetical protein